MNRWFSKGLVLMLVPMLGACATEEEAQADTSAPVESCVLESYNAPENCAFDPENEGKTVGFSAGNFCFPEQKEGEFWLHDYCGTQDLVWLILSTGWCIPCQEHAPYIDEIYQAYKDQGLVVVWVIGETLDYAPPNQIAVDKFIQARAVTFPVVFDYRHKKVYEQLDPQGSSYPHMYLLDGQTMELLARQATLGYPIEEMIIDRYGESDVLN